MRYHLGKIHPRATIFIEGKRRLYNQVKTIDSLWLMKETNNITVGIDVILNKSAIIHNFIRGFINMIHG